MQVLYIITVLLFTLIFCHCQTAFDTTEIDMITDDPSESSSTPTGAISFSSNPSATDLTVTATNTTEPPASNTTTPSVINPTNINPSSPTTNNVTQPLQTFSSTSTSTTTSATTSTTTEESPPPPPSKSNLPLILGLSLGLGIPVLLAISIGIFWYFKSSTSKNTMHYKTDF